MAEKIKVLRIIARLNTGGPAAHVLLLNSGLDKGRFSSFLATGVADDGEQDLIGLAKEMDVATFLIPELGRRISPARDLAAFMKIDRLIKELRPDIVHTHTAKAGALGRAAAALNRVPVKVHTFHGHVFHSYFGPLKSRLFVFIERILSSFTDRVVVISDSQLEEIRDTYRVVRQDKCSVIPLGLDLGRFSGGDGRSFRREVGAGEDTLLVGIVGRLVEVKDHRTFIDAAKIVSDRIGRVRVKFLIIGDGMLRGELESYARRLGMDGSVAFLGWRSDMPSAYKGLDLACLTSLNEGTPISLIEAMASGRAVVSTDVGGVKNVVTHKETGVLCAPGDAEGFAAAVTGLLREREMRERMGAAGRASVLKKFSKERLIGDMERLYTQELAKRSTG